LKAETVHDIFVPALPEKGVKSLSGFVLSEGNSWSTALAVCTTDLTGGRRKGSTWCKFKSSIALNKSLFKFFLSLFRGRMGGYKVLHGSDERDRRCVWCASSAY
jgi:hypothetical protein